MEPGLLVALGFAGNYVSGAFDADGRMVGTCAGFLGAPRRRAAALAHRGRPPRRSARHRYRAQAPPAGWCAATRHRRHRLDLRPAHRPERVVQPGPARRARRGVPRRLLRPDGRRPQRRRGERPAARALAGRARGGDAAAEEPERPTPRWSSAPTARPSPTLASPSTPDAVTLAVPADVEALRAGRSRTTATPRRAGGWCSATAYADLHEQGWRVRGFVTCRPLRAPRPDDPHDGAPMIRTSTSVVLHLVRLPLVSPFTTSFGTETERLALLLEARTTVSTTGQPRGRPGGASASRRRNPPTPASTSPAPGRCSSTTCCRASSRRSASGRSAPRPSARCWPRWSGTRWPRPRWRWRCSTRSCGPRAPRSPTTSA